MQPVTLTISPALSALFAQPLPGVGVAVAPEKVCVGTGSVGTAPVGVYVGKSVADMPPTVAGGHVMSVVADAGI